ncbi:MAG TPA: copper resistance protein B [Methylophaga aminisulfidivorans]|uniref:Copper resistance protein B n=4 Tax=root TaxID=1 RepID=C0N3B6_9GAMM|nr:copper resistance protein B [Methylophaga thiooxydans]EEF80752.1 Copper resistance protein B precursor [Methylophaga thiooxydans DMS010]KGM07694.1 Copper resistance protein B [Methylophaga thiooxydans]HDZ16451.1 copper resistance protein B [Methylophaga aminisulfidivorans]HEC73494.1 copper resistance protein B [Methylophaga aminisulfidivorans]
MKRVKTLTGLLLLGFASVVSAQHAEDDWPEPMKTSLTGQLMIDRLEISQTDNGDNVVTWDAIGWYGGDEKRLYIKTEGENQLNDGEPSELESAEVLASHLIAPFWEFQAGLGLRGSLDSDVNREHYAVFSLFGLAPYRFEIDQSLTVNEDGDIAASLEAEYDLRLTQVSYLQPRLEVAAALTDALDYDRPRGFNSMTLGLRYRYELSREFAPYIGAYWRQSFAKTADLEAARGKDDSEFGMVIGVRMWF